MNTDKWKPIPGFRKSYLINEDTGQVKSIDRLVKHSKGKGKRKVKECILKPIMTKEGYLVVCLHKKGISYRRYIHRLLALTFIKNNTPATKRCVNHLNGDKLDNRLVNLEWCTHKENIDHALKLGLMKAPTGRIEAIKVIDKCNDIIYPSIYAAHKATKISMSQFDRMLHGEAKNNTCMELLAA